MVLKNRVGLVLCDGSSRRVLERSEHDVHPEGIMRMRWRTRHGERQWKGAVSIRSEESGDTKGMPGATHSQSGQFSRFNQAAGRAPG